MGELPPSSTGEALRVPVPRDPPPPPGYVDPLDGNGALDDLFPADLPADLPADHPDADHPEADHPDADRPEADQGDQPPTKTGQRRAPTT